MYDLPKTRKIALSLKTLHYFTNKKCKRGHISKRLTSDGSCCECTKHRKLQNVEKELIRKRKWKADNVSKVRESSKKYREENREELRRKSREYSKNNKERSRVNAITYRENNRERVNERARIWTKNNLHKCRLRNANRRARKLKATPIWADVEKIKFIYLNCPKGFEVDHIVPLKGKSVSGLHVENNLQYLTVTANRRKHNKYER